MTQCVDAEELEMIFLSENPYLRIAQLNELDTEGVPAMAQVGEMLGLAAATHGEDLRADVIRPSLDRALVMAEAPESDGRFFKVPKVIDRS